MIPSKTINANFTGMQWKYAIVGQNSSILRVNYITQIVIISTN